MRRSSPAIRSGSLKIRANVATMTPATNTTATIAASRLRPAGLEDVLVTAVTLDRENGDDGWPARSSDARRAARRICPRDVAPCSSCAKAPERMGQVPGPARRRGSRRHIADSHTQDGMPRM